MGSFGYADRTESSFALARQSEPRSRAAKAAWINAHAEVAALRALASALEAPASAFDSNSTFEAIASAALARMPDDLRRSALIEHMGEAIARRRQPQIRWLAQAGCPQDRCLDFAKAKDKGRTVFDLIGYSGRPDIFRSLSWVAMANASHGFEALEALEQIGWAKPERSGLFDGFAKKIGDEKIAAIVARDYHPWVKATGWHRDRDSRYSEGTLEQAESVAKIWAPSEPGDVEACWHGLEMLSLQSWSDRAIGALIQRSAPISEMFRQDALEAMDECLADASGSSKQAAAYFKELRTWLGMTPGWTSEFWARRYADSVVEALGENDWGLAGLAARRLASSLATAKKGSVSAQAGEELSRAIAIAASGSSGSNIARDPECRKAIALALKALDGAQGKTDRTSKPRL